MKYLIPILLITLAACASEEPNAMPVPGDPTDEMIDTPEPDIPRPGDTVAFPTIKSWEDFCGEAGGTWIESAQECEGVDETWCGELSGRFDPCASACRNDPAAEVCTLQCVQVCAFG